jgi:hypothetical protein
MTELDTFLDRVAGHPKFQRAAAMDPTARDKLALLRHYFGRLYECGADNPAALELLDQVMSIVRSRGSLRRRARALVSFIESDTFAL